MPSERNSDDALYQDRLLVYVDILGWSAACRGSAPQLLRQALAIIHRQAEWHSEPYHQKLLEQEGRVIETEIGPMRMGEANPLFLQKQFAAFSDHFVFSMPASFGARILGIGEMIRDLLRLGFATRGAVTRGPLYHLDNVIFGPALLEAVSIEESEAIYPRVLISETALSCRDQLGHLADSAWGQLVEDHLRRMVVNPFPIGISGSSEAIDSLIRENFWLSEIKARIDDEIQLCEASGNKKHSEKWQYLRDFITGPIFMVTPQLAKHWT